MSGVSTYLNFTDQTEEARNFYEPVFGIALVMHVALPILG